MRGHRNTPEAFWSRVSIRLPWECWPWLGRTDRGGYGKFSWDGTYVIAHRLAFFFTRGYWPALHALHSCDSPPCCNPDHISEGTHSENMRQAFERGRKDTSGEGNGNAKLSAQDVRAIRAALLSGESHRSLARRFGVGTAQISYIRTGRAWRDRAG